MAVTKTNGSETRPGTREPRGRRAGRGPAAPVGESPAGLPLRRHWGRVAAGGVLALLGAWVAASLVASAGERVDVVVTARDVGQFEEVERDDLRLVRVAADPGVDTIGGDELDELVGRVAATGLPEGVLLSPSQLVPAGERLVGADEAVVGTRLGPGAAPGGLQGGTSVLVVVRPQQGSPDDEVSEVQGWLAEIGEPDESSRSREASLVVPASVAGGVAAAAADERIAVVALRDGS